MKKSVKIVVALAIIVAVGIGGFAMHQHQEKEKMIAIATSEEAKKVYEEYLRKFDSLALTPEGKIKEYSIDVDDLEYNPMGGLMVRLVINQSKKLDVQIGIYENEKGVLEVFGATSSAEFGQLIKEGDE